MTSFSSWDEAGEKLQTTLVQNKNKIPSNQQDIQLHLKTIFLSRVLSTHFLTSCSFLKKQKQKQRKSVISMTTTERNVKDRARAVLFQSRFLTFFINHFLQEGKKKKSKQLAFNKDSKQRVGRSAVASQKDSPRLGD